MAPMQLLRFSSLPYIQQQLQGLSGVKNIANDIIVYEQTHEEHDMNLDKCLQPLFDRGLCLNQAECSFSRALKFFGPIFSGNGSTRCP